MSEYAPKQIVETLLFAADEPLGIDRIYKILSSGGDSIEMSTLRNILHELSDEYSEGGVELKEVASGWRFQVRSDLSPWVNKLHEERPPRYSRAFLEILSLIAYRQPITRAEIEDVRGVAVSSNIMKTLLEHEWVKVVGYKEVPGKPALFATTKKFLDHFNLKHLDELPPLMEFTETLVMEGALQNIDPQKSEPNEVNDGLDGNDNISNKLTDQDDSHVGDSCDASAPNENTLQDEDRENDPQEFLNPLLEPVAE
jgi:segregation and condensation protein B